MMAGQGRGRGGYSSSAVIGQNSKTSLGALHARICWLLLAARYSSADLPPEIDAC